MQDILASLSTADISLVLLAVVFLASCMQAITGMGFGVIAGPVLLVSMGSASAIQVSIVLSFLIAALLSPATLPRVNRGLILPLLLGVALGTPVGALLYISLNLSALKILAAIVVGAMTIIATGWLTKHPLFERDTRLRRVVVGVLCGALNATLAMPGPPVAAYATAIKADMQTIRATTLVTFLLAYPVALGFQWGFSELSEELWTVGLPLALPTALGTLTGLLVAPLFDERIFRWVAVTFLTASVAALVLAV